MSSFTSKLILAAALAGFVFPLSAKNAAKKPPNTTPLYQGVNLGVEFGGTAVSLFTNDWQASAKLDVNIKNAFFPTLELGRGTYNRTGATGMRFTTAGTYFKLGLNLPVTQHGAKAEDMFYAGLHYGFSTFGYDLSQLTFSGGYWGSPTSSSFTGEKAVAGWAEAVAGVRVKVFGPVSLGWSLHYRSLLHVSKGKHSVPAYIPGYGQQVKPYAGINTHVYYRF